VIRLINCFSDKNSNFVRSNIESPQENNDSAVDIYVDSTAKISDGIEPGSPEWK
ncbi:hypothetical protein L9F63_018775, partial [Diploptera punctata]